MGFRITMEISVWVCLVGIFWMRSSASRYKDTGNVVALTPGWHLVVKRKSQLSNRFVLLCLLTAGTM